MASWRILFKTVLLPSRIRSCFRYLLASGFNPNAAFCIGFVSRPCFASCLDPFFLHLIAGLRTGSGMSRIGFLWMYIFTGNSLFRYSCSTYIKGFVPADVPVYVSVCIFRDMKSLDRDALNRQVNKTCNECFGGALRYMMMHFLNTSPRVIALAIFFKCGYRQ